MAKTGSRLARVVDALRKYYGAPPPPEVTDPWEMILFESIAYLASDERRSAAWKQFRKSIGVAPERILAASPSALLPMTRAGILAEDRVDRLKEAAAIAAKAFDGDLDAAVGEGVPRRRAQGACVSSRASASRARRRSCSSRAARRSWPSSRTAFA